MRTVAVANQKGGVGKTSLAVNLSAALGELGRRVLLVDLDPSGDASRWLGVSSSDALWEALTAGADPSAAILEIGAEKGAQGVWVLPASADLLALERELLEAPRRGLRVAEMVERLPMPFDYAVLDTPPSVNLVTVNALLAADLVMIPVEGRVLGLGGLADLVRDLDDLERLGLVRRYVPSRVTRTRLARDIEEQVREVFGAEVMAATIRETVTLAESPGFERTILAHAPRAPVADDFRAVARELEKTWHELDASAGTS